MPENQTPTHHMINQPKYITKLLAFQSKTASCSGQSISQGKALNVCSSLERDTWIWTDLNVRPQEMAFFSSHGVKKLLVCNGKHKTLCNLQKQEEKQQN